MSHTSVTMQINRDSIGKNAVLARFSDERTLRLVPLNANSSIAVKFGFCPLSQNNQPCEADFTTVKTLFQQVSAPNPHRCMATDVRILSVNEAVSILTPPAVRVYLHIPAILNKPIAAAPAPNKIIALINAVPLVEKAQTRPPASTATATSITTTRAPMKLVSASSSLS